MSPLLLRFGKRQENVRTNFVYVYSIPQNIFQTNAKPVDNFFTSQIN